MRGLLCTQNLCCQFGGVMATNDVCFNVDHNGLTSIIGPNGAGKTTTVRMLTTLLRPTGGSAHVAGLDVVDDAAADRHAVTTEELGHRVMDQIGTVVEWPEEEGCGEGVVHDVSAGVWSSENRDTEPGVSDGVLLDGRPRAPVGGWEAGVLFEETTSTLLCGDLFTQLGDGPAIRDDSPMEPTIVAENTFGYSSLAPSTAATVGRLAELAPTTLALMHGPAYSGDGAQSLRDLAADYRRR